MNSVLTFKGKCSCFGGPADTGMKLDEGLALVESKDLLDPYFARLFLPQRGNGTGLGRSLNPNSFYCAMRWDEVLAEFGGPSIRRILAREAMVRVTAGPLHLWVQPIDDGPNPDTGRVIDLSPQTLKRLGIKTDDEVTVEVFA